MTLLLLFPELLLLQEIPIVCQSMQGTSFQNTLGYQPESD